MIKSGALKKELQATIDNVLNEIDFVRATTMGPVVLDRTWILNKCNDYLIKDQYIVESRAIEVARGLGHLHKLPREVRDSVYTYAITNGTMALLCASKQTNKEAGALIFQHGIYRLALFRGYSAVDPSLPQSLQSKIQNLELQVNTCRGTECKLHTELFRLNSLYGSSIEPKNCTIIIVCDRYFPDMCATEIFPALGEMAGFGQVTLELDLYEKNWIHPRKKPELSVIWAAINWAVSDYMETLKPTLGTANRYPNGESYRWVFHPREWSSKGRIGHQSPE